MNYELNIYPNPAEDFFNIDLGDLSQSDLKDVTIQLFDMSGRLIRTLRTEDSIVQIETGGINAGTYLVFVTRNSDNVVRKVVIR